MATELMPPPSPKPISRKRQDPTPRDIINTARQSRPSASGAVRVGLLTAGLMWASFTPVDFGPLGWVCLVPLLLLVRLERPTQWMYTITYLAGALFWFPTLQWMRLGDPTMYIAWGALSLYLAAYFPIFVGLSRIGVQRLKLPLILVAPIVWTALEYIRAYALTGFSWYYLGHSQYRWIELIQISDLFGAYGVSFLVALASAVLADLMPLSVFKSLKLVPANSQEEGTAILVPSRKKQWAQVVTCVVLVSMTLGYGYYRRSGESFRPGPRVAAIQGNFVASVRNNDDPNDIFRTHFMLTREAVKQQPDLVIWPEGMFGWPLMIPPLDLSDKDLHAAVPEIPLNRWHDPMVGKTISGISKQAGAAMVIGMETVTADKSGLKAYNSAVFVTPEKGVSQHYDKIHRVPFGEYLPLRDSMPWLASFSPYRGNLGIQAGKYAAAFEHKNVLYAPVICFEDTVPQVVRNAVSGGSKGKKADVLLNLTNDGWFHGSSELDQHLITAAFRCVEFRTPMVRAVNAGISAIIDGDGVIRHRAIDPKTKKSKQVNAVLVNHVPLDSRSSQYLQNGDVFAQICLTLCGLLLVAGVLAAILFKPNQKAARA